MAIGGGDDGAPGEVEATEATGDHSGDHSGDNGGYSTWMAVAARRSPWSVGTAIWFGSAEPRVHVLFGRTLPTRGDNA